MKLPHVTEALMSLNEFDSTLCKSIVKVVFCEDHTLKKQQLQLSEVIINCTACPSSVRML